VTGSSSTCRSACSAAYGHPAVEAERAWVRAIDLLRAHPEDPRNFWARRGLSTAYSAQGKITAYAAIAEETLDLARQSGDPAGLRVAHMIFANLKNYSGNFAAAEQATFEAARYFREEARHKSFDLSGLDIAAHIPLARALAQSFLGNHAEADESMNQALRLAEAQPQVGVLVWAQFWVSFCCLIERDFGRAEAVADRAFALATEHGFGFWATGAQLSQGAALVIADPERAATVIGAGLAKLDSLGSRYYFHSIYPCFEAEALLRLGRIAEARTAIDRALAITASTGLIWWNADLHRIRAAVIGAEGDDDDAARDALTRAVAIAEQQGSETFRHRAAADLAALGGPAH